MSRYVHKHTFRWVRASLFFVGLALVIGSLCGVPVDAQEPTVTETLRPTPTPIFTDTPTVEPTPTDPRRPTPTPMDTWTPTGEPTDTPTAEPTEVPTEPPTEEPPPPPPPPPPPATQVPPTAAPTATPTPTPTTAASAAITDNGERLPLTGVGLSAALIGGLLVLILAVVRPLRRRVHETTEEELDKQN